METKTDTKCEVKNKPEPHIDYMQLAKQYKESRLYPDANMQEQMDYERCGCSSYEALRRGW